MAEFNIYSDVKLSERAVRRYMYRMKINSYVSVQKPFRISRNRVVRLQWAVKHQDLSTAR